MPFSFFFHRIVILHVSFRIYLRLILRFILFPIFCYSFIHLYFFFLICFLALPLFFFYFFAFYYIFFSYFSRHFFFSHFPAWPLNLLHQSHSHQLQTTIKSHLNSFSFSLFFLNVIILTSLGSIPSHLFLFFQIFWQAINMLWSSIPFCSKQDLSLIFLREMRRQLYNLTVL